MATSGLVILLPMSVPSATPAALWRTPEMAVMSSGEAEARPSVATPISDPPKPVAMTTRSIAPRKKWALRSMPIRQASGEEDVGADPGARLDASLLQTIDMVVFLFMKEAHV